MAQHIVGDFRQTHSRIDPRHGITATRKIAILGAGQVVEHRLLPALLSDLAAPGVETPIVDAYRVVIFSDAKPAFDLPDNVEFRLLPTRAIDASLLRALADADMLGDDVLGLICTPDATHVPLLALLRDHVGRLACEKPLCLTAAEAVWAVQLADGYDIRAYSHFLKKPAMRELLQRTAANATNTPLTQGTKS